MEAAENVNAPQPNISPASGIDAGAEELEDFIAVWANAGDFALNLANILHGSEWQWRIVNGVDEMDSFPLGACKCMLIDSEDASAGFALRQIRNLPGYEKLPVVLIGPDPRNELQGDPFLFHLVRLSDTERLWTYIGKEHRKRPLDNQSNNGIARSSYRYFCNQETTVELPIMVVDLSEGGAQLEAPFVLKPGTIVPVNLLWLSPALSRPIKFRVVDVRPCLPPKQAFRMRGKFEELSKSQEYALRRALMRLQIRTARDVMDSNRNVTR